MTFTLKAQQDLAHKAVSIPKVKRDADQALETGPFSVVDAAKFSPSDSLHDYVSVGPYWWPNPDTEDGLPYVRRDGQVNPQRHQGDCAKMTALAQAIGSLSLAYYHLADERYAQRAWSLLRHFFIEEATYMSPHLEYGQGIPGVCEGRGIGIIDTNSLIKLIDSVQLLRSSPNTSTGDLQELQHWFSRYLHWLLTSKKGQDERNAANNHATWYYVQAVVYALFVEDHSTAKSCIERCLPSLLCAHINPDGSQPQEYSRTRGLDYSTMNLEGLCELAHLAQRFSRDFWHYASDDGRSIKQAINWLKPYIVSPDTWPYQQITPYQPQKGARLLQTAHQIYGDPEYKQALAGLKPPTE